MTSAQPCDWPVNKTVAKYNRYMLENEIETDVKFVVGPEDGDTKEFNVHKYILISRSPVFYAMLCGGLKETGDSIRVPDITVDSFHQLMR